MNERRAICRARARASFRRLLEGFVALCLFTALLPDVWRLAHFVTVRHVACPYDGMLVHEEDEAAPRRRVEAPHVPPHALPVSIVPHHGHGGCSDLATLNRPLAAPLLPSWALEYEERGYLEPLELQSHRLPTAVLSYAPKLSPPA